jgi:hypothetical protein
MAKPDAGEGLPTNQKALNKLAADQGTSSLHMVDQAGDLCCDAQELSVQLRRRRAAAMRSVPLGNGFRDPLELTARGRRGWRA